MKRNLYMSIALVLCSFFLIGAQAFAAPALFDDFSTGYLSGEKWWPREYVREIEDGKLVSKLGNSVGMGAEVAPGVFRNNVEFVDPAPIQSIQCEITIIESKLDSAEDAKSFARIAGYFYNVNTTGGATGDIFAMLMIGNQGNGLEVFWEAQRMLSDDTRTWEIIGTGTISLPEPLQYGIPCVAELSYSFDEPSNTNTIHFTVDGHIDSFIGPPRQREAQALFKGLSTGINESNGSSTGYISAEFDNVYVNGSLYDDFSTSPLDQTKWSSLEFVREISGNETLRANVQAENYRRDARTAPNDQTTAYLEAKVLVESGSQVSLGALGVARIGGYYHNDSRGPGSGQDYNGFEGDAYVINRIELDDSNNLGARCRIVRKDTSDPYGPMTVLFNQIFTTPMAFDTAYTLSIEFTGSTFIFKCNGETYQYDITTPRYPPSIGQYRRLDSRVYADSGESGYMKATFDDVYTGFTAQATYDATGKWVYTETDAWDSCRPGLQPGTEILTITQTGNEFTLAHGGGTDTGTVSGSYYAWFEQDGDDREWASFILSSSSSGSGRHEDRFWFPEESSWCEGGALFTLTKAECLPCGDVNLDDDLTPGDALVAFQHYLAIADPPLTECQLDQADVTLDEDITPADALCIFQKYLAIPSCLDGRPECPWD